MRNSSFELLRILAILLIVAMHILGYIDHTQLSPLNQAVLAGVNIIGNTGVSCFILVSGYFGVKFNARKFIYLIVISSVYSLFVEYLNDGFQLKELIKAFLIIPRYKLWFIVCYLFLMILSPYLNLFTEMLNRKEFTRLIVTLTLLLCVVPSLFPEAGTTSVILFQGGKNLTYFLFLYILGRYIKKYYDNTYSRIRLYAIHLASSLLIALAWLLTKALFVHDCNILILISSVSLFYFFKSFQFHSRLVNFVSSSVLAIYVLNRLFVFVDNHLIHIQDYASDSLFAVYLGTEVLLVSLIAIAIDKTVGEVIKKIVRI